MSDTKKVPVLCVPAIPMSGLTADYIKALSKYLAKCRPSKLEKQYLNSRIY